MLASDFVFGIRQPLGESPHGFGRSTPRGASSSTWTSADADRPRVRADWHRLRRQGRPGAVRCRGRGGEAAGSSRIRQLGGQYQGRKNSVDYLRKTHFDNVPMKPTRVYQCMNRKACPDTTYVSPSACRRLPARSFLRVKPATGSTAARPARWAGRARRPGRARPTHAQDRGLVGRLRLQFMIEELAVGAQFKLPYVHVLVNNSYLGLIRQSQRAFPWTTACSWRSTISTWKRGEAARLRRGPCEGGRGPGLQRRFACTARGLCRWP